MAVARNKTVVPGQAGFYHCYTRCVRRSFLCGVDTETKSNYEHRRQWLVDRIHEATRLFAVDIYAYAIMHNHYHIVLYVDPARVAQWTDHEVAERWFKVYAWRRTKKKTEQRPVQPTADQLEIWRKRLGSLSWMMRTINEPIARWANVEDDVTGHFWEGRFNSLPILDEIGLVACMSYVDLNPVRGGLALDLESSEFTSIQKRINELSSLDHQSNQDKTNASLGPLFSTSAHCITLSMNVIQYIELVRQTALDVIEEKLIQNQVLSGYGVSIANWVFVVKRLRKLFRTAVGNRASFESFMQKTQRNRHRDLTGREYLYG